MTDRCTLLHRGGLGIDTDLSDSAVAVGERGDLVNRRCSLRLALATALAWGAPLTNAQTAPQRPRRVGVLAPSTHAKEAVTLAPFFDEMRSLGWIEGQTIEYDRAYADDRQDALPRLATELVARKPELIYAPPPVAATAAKRATQTIPIVFGTGADPVGSGLVASLARPGGNVTGISAVADSLAPKRVELLREIMPRVRRLGVLADPGDPSSRTEYVALSALAPALGLIIVRADASNAAVLDAAIAQLLEQRPEAILTDSAFAFNVRERLIEAATRARLPVIGHRAQMADVGALFAYGALLADQLRRSAHLVDKVLKGAKPADLPVEQPVRFELVVNLRTAKALELKIPQSLLLRADRVIE